MKHIVFTVTNDLTYDRRMHRICHSMASNGYCVTLVGRKLKNSKPIVKQTYNQIRLYCFFKKSFLFYAEYNIRLFFFLFFQKMDAVCAIDLDTILPCLFVSKLKSIKRIYDAHELFTELKEVITRPRIHNFWLAIERLAVPKFRMCYTVGGCIAMEFKERYGNEFEVIRNVPLLNKTLPQNLFRNKLLLYQGAVNEGRCLEQLVSAMKYIDYRMLICGDGNFMEKLKKLIWENKVEDKIELRGMILPNELLNITHQCTLGINFVERGGLNQYLSLANKFFDYIHAGVPQITMNFPEYRSINEQFEVALLIDDLSERSIAECIMSILKDEDKWKELQENCFRARRTLNWQEEEKKLISFYEKVFAC